MADDNWEIGFKAVWDSDDNKIRESAARMKELEQAEKAANEARDEGNRRVKEGTKFIDEATSALKSEIIQLAAVYAGWSKLKALFQESLEEEKALYQLGEAAASYGEDADKARDATSALANAVVQWGEDDMEAIRLVQEMTTKLGGTEKAIDAVSLAYKINAADSTKSTASMANMIAQLEQGMPRALMQARRAFGPLLKDVKDNDEALAKLYAHFKDSAPNMDLAANRLKAFSVRLDEFYQGIVAQAIPGLNFLLTAVEKIGLTVSVAQTYFLTFVQSLMLIGRSMVNLAKLDFEAIKLDFKQTAITMGEEIDAAWEGLVASSTGAAKQLGGALPSLTAEEKAKAADEYRAAYQMLAQEKLKASQLEGVARVALEEDILEREEELNAKYEGKEFKRIKREIDARLKLQIDAIEEARKAREEDAEDDVKRFNEAKAREARRAAFLRQLDGARDVGRQKAIDKDREEHRARILNATNAARLINTTTKGFDKDRLQQHRAALAAMTMQEGVSAAQKVALNRAAAEATVEIAKIEAEQKQQLAQQAVTGAIGTLAGAFPQVKAFAVADAIISTYQGAALAIKTYPPPYSFIAAAAQVAAGMAHVQRIMQTEPGAGGGGGGAATTSAPPEPRVSVGGRGGGGGGAQSTSYSTTVSNGGQTNIQIRSLTPSEEVRSLKKLNDVMPRGERATNRQVLNPEKVRVGTRRD